MPTMTIMPGGVGSPAGAFSGIFEVGEMLDDFVGRAAKAEAQSKKTAAAIAQAVKEAQDFAKLNAELEKQGMHAERGRLGESFTGVTVLPGTPGLAPGELFTPEQINKLGQRIADLGPGEKVAKSLEDLAGRIEKLLGSDNYIAKLLEIEIPYLRKGARSADEATALVQSVLIPFMAAFQRELANPTTPPEMRKLLVELMNLAQSGQHQLDNLLREFEKNDAAQKGIDKTLDEIRKRQDAANAFVENMGKKVDAADKKQDAIAQHVTESVALAKDAASRGIEFQQRSLEFWDRGASQQSRLEMKILELEKLALSGKGDQQDTLRQLKEIAAGLRDLASGGAASADTQRIADDLERWVLSHGS